MRVGRAIVHAAHAARSVRSGAVACTAVLLSLFAAGGCGPSDSPISGLSSALAVDINGGDTVKIDPILKSGTDIQLRCDTQTWASADGFSFTTRSDFYAYSVGLGHRVDLYTRPAELYVLSGGSYYLTLAQTVSGIEVAP